MMTKELILIAIFGLALATCIPLKATDDQSQEHSHEPDSSSTTPPSNSTTADPGAETEASTPKDPEKDDQEQPVTEEAVKEVDNATAPISEAVKGGMSDEDDLDPDLTVAEGSAKRGISVPGRSDEEESAEDTEEEQEEVTEEESGEGPPDEEGPPEGSDEDEGFEPSDEEDDEDEDESEEPTDGSSEDLNERSETPPDTDDVGEQIDEAIVIMNKLNSNFGKKKNAKNFT